MKKSETYRISYYTLLFVFGLILWFIGTWHGGFQSEAQSNFEKFTDTFGFICMTWGIIGDIFTGLEIHKHEYK